MDWARFLSIFISFDNPVAELVLMLFPVSRSFVDPPLDIYLLTYWIYIDREFEYQGAS